MTLTIVSVGHDNSLMPIRTLLLRHAGYAVTEAYTCREALQRLISGQFDLVLICHTITEDEKSEFIPAVRVLQPEVPIVCIRTHEHYPNDEICRTVDNVAPRFLTDINAVLCNPDAVDDGQAKTRTSGPARAQERRAQRQGEPFGTV